MKRNVLSELMETELCPKMMFETKKKLQIFRKIKRLLRNWLFKDMRINAAFLTQRDYDIVTIKYDLGGSLPPQLIETELLNKMMFEIREKEYATFENLATYENPDRNMIWKRVSLKVLVPKRTLNNY